MNITQKYLPTNTKRRPGIKNKGIKFIVAHDTGNLNSTAEQNVNYFISSAKDIEASAHAFVDDKGVIECIPDDEVAYHVRRLMPADNNKFGCDSNDSAIGVELCFFSDIKRTEQSYKNYVEYIKSKCTEYNLDVNKLVEGHYKLDPTRRTDPLNAFKIIGKDWNSFLVDLNTLNKKQEIKLEINRLVEML